MAWRTAAVCTLGAALVVTACASPTGGGSTAATVRPATTTTTSTTAPPVVTTPPPTTAPAPDLQRVVRRFVRSQPVDWSVIVVDLETGARGEHRPEREVWSASLYKLFVARSLLGQIRDGELDPTAKAPGAGGRAWDECIRDMIVVSDDDCGVAGIAHLGRGAHDPVLAEAGYPGTHLGNPQRTDAADVARLLLATRDGSLLGAGAGEVLTARLWDLLGRQEVDDRLSLGLPEGTPFAHKTGDRTGWAHDAGVFTTRAGDVLVVALSGPHDPPCCHAEAPGPAERQAFEAFATLARRVHRAVTGG